MSMYILTEAGRSFKTFLNLKENYAIALAGQLLLIYRKMLSKELNMILIVLMETLDIPEIHRRFDEYLAI